MASGRGLNKKRGLESLIPHKIDNEEVKNKEEERGSHSNQEEISSQSSNADTLPISSGKAVPDHPIREGASDHGTADHDTAENELAADFTNYSDDSSASASKKPGNAAEKLKGTEEGVVLLVSLTEVVPNQEQPRKEFKDASIHELAESIRQYGVLQPLLVQKKDKYYVIVAGERRWRAAKEAGLKKIPVILKNFDDQEQMEISLIENIQREDLNAIEEAEAYRRLIDEFHLTQDEVAVKVGKSRSTITNALRLLKLAKPVRHLLVNGDISMGHARALLAVENEEAQISAAHQVIQKKLSVRETEKLVKNILKPRKQRVKPEMDEQTALAYKSIEENLQKLVGSKVLIKPEGDRGKIEIEYYSQEELERIIDLIG